MCALSDEEIWDRLGILADGEWTLADLWDRARLEGVAPSMFFPECFEAAVS